MRHGRENGLNRPGFSGGSTGVESATHASSVHNVESRTNAPITERIASAAARNRVLYPGCCGR